MFVAGALLESISTVRSTATGLVRPDEGATRCGEADKVAAHLYHARRQYRRTCERPNKGNRAIEREVVSSYQVAQSLGFKDDFRAWEHLLMLGRYSYPLRSHFFRCSAVFLQ